MKKIISFTSLFFVCLVASAQIATHRSLYEEIDEDPARAGGVYYMYDFSPRENPAAPKGYKPFYISHYGRHGARYILRDEMYDYVYEVLAKSHEDGKLTPEGELAYQRVSEIYPGLKGKAGLLTVKGGQQHRLLAQRMYKNYPEVFRTNKAVRAGSTDVIRCILSMGYFCGGLASMDPKLDIQMLVSDESTATYNQYWYNSKSKYCDQSDMVYKTPKSSWYPAYLEFCQQKKENINVHNTVFNDQEYAHREFNLIDFQSYLFFFATNLGCTEYSDVDLLYLFSTEDLCNLVECDVYTYYAQKGGSPDYSARSKQLSTVLLDDILEVSNQDIASGEVAARLRFGHDGNLMGIYNLMGFDDWKEESANPSDITTLWRLYDIPMASNMQIVFYRTKKASDPILIRFMHNENTLILKDLPQDFAPYYRWEDFYNYYKPISDAHK